MQLDHDPDQRIAVLYEHPEWFKPLFAELNRRAIEYQPLLPDRLRFYQKRSNLPYCLVLNRMSPSAFLRGQAQAIFDTRELLKHWAALGVPVINGYAAYLVEISKVHQLRILEGLGVCYPRSIVISRPVDSLEAAEQLPFPLLVKPNVGGSGANILRFDDRASLIDAVVRGRINLGIDQTGLVQHYVRPRGGFIVRVEILDGEVLYAIKIYPPAVGALSRARPIGLGRSATDAYPAALLPNAGGEVEQVFNLCPADICQAPDGAASQATSGEGYCLGEAQPKRALRVEAYQPPDEVIRQVLAIGRAAQLDLGGIEYLIDDENGEPTFYDINALSNFVTNAEEIVGFDPFVRLVDFILRRATVASAVSKPWSTMMTPGYHPALAELAAAARD